MSTTVDIKALLKLSAEQRASIIEVLLESLERDAPGPSKADIKQRIKAYRENPDQSLLSWDQLTEAVGWDK